MITITVTIEELSPGKLAISRRGEPTRETSSEIEVANRITESLTIAINAEADIMAENGEVCRRWIKIQLLEADSLK